MNRLDSFMFLDDELRKKFNNLKINVECEICEYLENAARRVLTCRLLLNVSRSVSLVISTCVQLPVFMNG